MWVESITIENIKCFQEDTLSFARNPNEKRAFRRKPNLQFFVATHSPLVAAGAGHEALTLRFEMIEGTLKVIEIPYIELAADVNRTLTSPAFGLQSTYSPPTEKKIQRYHQLNRKRSYLGSEEKQECEQLELFMKEVKPFSDRPEPGSLEDRINSFLEKKLP